MHKEYCPHCTRLRELRKSQSIVSPQNKQSKEELIIINAYHCATCGAFIRDEKAVTPV